MSTEEEMQAAQNSGLELVTEFIIIIMKSINSIDIGSYVSGSECFQVAAWWGLSEKILLEPRSKDKPWKLNNG